MGVVDSFFELGWVWLSSLLSCREELSIVNRTGKSCESILGSLLDVDAGMLDGFDM